MWQCLKLGRKGAPPVPPSNILADFAGGGLLCAMGILLALLERQKSNVGQVIDSAMQDGVLYMGTMMYICRKYAGWNKEHGNNLFDSGAPFYDVYECKDGKYMSVGAVENHFWKIFIRQLGVEKDIDTSKQMDESTWENTKTILTNKFKTKSRAEWEEIFKGTDSCAFPVLEFDEVASNVHNSTREILISSPDENEYEPAPAPRLSRTPGTNVVLPNPIDGEHTISVLKEFKFSDQEISQLITERVIYSNSKAKL